jgi:hypothetical protein
MDLKFCYDSLFRLLERLRCDRGIAIHWDKLQSPLGQCFAALFHPKRSLSAIRVAAFVQKLTDIAISSLDNVNVTVYLVDSIKSILTNHPNGRAILDDEAFGSGSYQISCIDPDLCNPFSRSLLPLLRNIKSAAGKGSKKIVSIIDGIMALRPDQ